MSILYKDFLKEEARKYPKYIRNAIEAKSDFAGVGSPPNSKKWAKKKGFNHWLKHTNHLKDEGFNATSGRNWLTAFATTKQHPKDSRPSRAPRTYKQLVGYHGEKGGYKLFTDDKLPLGFVERLENHAIKKIDDLFSN